ncbi:unnamed protein product [Kluyveromyces dobzhanskii CBS 2104]|uniref:WGS project CCBQ000000000 data, contig 00099 n=1 Tax=Kluyveromyces dobzhanskii CBS 2104 TaxID=1427455 RepID=A0A0A8L4N9_9SACH|nr:unnamed protein product [Kluyveromyces dobzhanskii CBS 2104]
MDDKCAVCVEETWKYKCPRCMKKTCSLACSKKHKETDSCSGIGNATEYVSSQSLKEADTVEEMNHLVQRDYNFLIGMNRKLSVLKEDGKSKNKRVLQKAPGAAGMNRYNVSKPPRVLRRGVKCLLLPKGMQRSVANKSKWDKPLDTFVWSIEWLLIDPSDNTWSHLSHRNKEESKLVDCIGKQVYDKCKEFYHRSVKGEDAENTTSSKEDRSNQMIELGFRFYTKWFSNNVESVMDTKEVIEVDPKKCVGEIFKDMTVIEFPTIFIVPDIQKLTAHGFHLHVAGSDEDNVPIRRLQDPVSRDVDVSATITSNPTEIPEPIAYQAQDIESQQPVNASALALASGSESDSSSECSAPEECSVKGHSDSEDDYDVGVSLDFLTA